MFFFANKNTIYKCLLLVVEALGLVPRREDALRGVLVNKDLAPLVAVLVNCLPC